MGRHVRTMPTLLAIVLFAGAAAAQSPVASVGAAAFNDDVYPTPKVAFPGGVTGLPGVLIYSPRNYRGVRMDIYLPPGQIRGPRPFVVFAHGGGWAGGSTRMNGAFTDWPGVLASLSAKGYVVASVDYRLLGDEIAPAAIQDFKAAIKYLRANASNYNIDRARGLVWGASAGGQIAALAGTACDVPALEPQRPAAEPFAGESACVQGAVGWYSTYDMRPMTGGYGPYLGCEKGRPCAAASMQSAITYLSDRTPPFLIVQGIDDKTVPVTQAQNFYAAMRDRNLKAELPLLPNVGHMFIGDTAERTKAASNEALEATFRFIDATIGSRQ